MLRSPQSVGGDGAATGSQLLSADDQDALPIIRGWLGSEDDRETLLAIVIQMTEITSTEWRYRTSLWGKPPDRGDTTPRHEPGTGREQSRNIPLGG